MARVDSATIGSSASRAPAGRRVARRLGVGKDGRALAEVVQHQRRQQQEPGTGDRLATEVAHVSVQRLGAGQRQYGGAEDGDTDAGMRAEERTAHTGFIACSTSGCWITP